MKKRTAGFLTAAAIFMAALCFLPAACGKQEIEVPEVRVLPAAGRLQEMTEKVEEEIAAAEKQGKESDGKKSLADRLPFRKK